LKEDNLGTTEFTSQAEDEDGGNDRQEIEDLRLLVPNVELSTGSTPNLLPGNAPSTFAQTLVTRIRNLLLGTSLLRARDLRILYTPPSGPEDQDERPETQVKGYWVLYIDTLFISLDGNAFDAAWLAILAALRDTKLPKAYFDEELETILCSDSPSDAVPISLRGLPVPSTFAVFEGRGEEDGDGEDGLVLNDPDAFEESVCRESVCVAVDKSKGRVDLRKVEKSGGGVVDREILKSLVKRAGERWDEWNKALSKKT
jgi:exosome complex component RRP43